jgi:putative membrane protein
MTEQVHRDPTLTKPLAAIVLVSAVACAVILALVYGRSAGATAGHAAWVLQLPLLNALFNALSAGLVVMGVRAIRAGDAARHKRLMLGAFAASGLFLVSYLTYHALHGDAKFPGIGWIRPVYFFILISHIGLSVIVLPLVLLTFFLSLSGRFPTHKRIARWTFPLWTYVSVTGVLIVLLLRAYS